MSAQQEDYWEQFDDGDLEAVARYVETHPDAGVAEILGRFDLALDRRGDVEQLLAAVREDADAATETCTRVGMWMHDDCDVYAGRGDGGDAHLLNTEPGDRGWLGNPFSLDDFERDEAIAAYARAVLDRCDYEPAFRNALGALQGEGVVLGCWCRRLEDDEPACHCDILVRMIDDVLVPVNGDGGGER